MAVMLVTSVGELVIGLFTDECPLTTKNFLKLCKIKYYNNCLFHFVQKDFIVQTGDPTGTGKGGDSVYKLLHGDQARLFDDEIRPTLRHDKVGIVAMASAGENANASQFYITTRAQLDYLDEKHTVFGEVAEGLEALMCINEAFVDDNFWPYKNIRIKHSIILEDPFDDPAGLADPIPEKSPELKPPAEGEAQVRLEDDWVLMDPEVLEKSQRQKQAQKRAVVLEMIGDVPEADVKPPENVLFVFKLNPLTEEGDLDLIFSRFGKVKSADIIRDYKTDDSLCYAFIEFETEEACEAAYFKMDNVLIDDRRIHVDFSQSVSQLWNRHRKFGKAAGGDGQPAANQGNGCFKCGEVGHFAKECPTMSELKSLKTALLRNLSTESRKRMGNEEIIQTKDTTWCSATMRIHKIKEHRKGLGEVGDKSLRTHLTPILTESWRGLVQIGTQTEEMKETLDGIEGKLLAEAAASPPSKPEYYSRHSRAYPDEIKESSRHDSRRSCRRDDEPEPRSHGEHRRPWKRSEREASEDSAGADFHKASQGRSASRDVSRRDDRRREGRDGGWGEARDGRGNGRDDMQHSKKRRSW